jgi:excisionase family DNA binding protein
MDDLRHVYLTTTEAAHILEINPKSAGFLARQGKLAAVKIANRWLIPRAAVEELAKTYVPKRGHPRKKRKYTKRSPRWFSKQP